MSFFDRFEKKVMAVIMKLIARYYLKKPVHADLISVKISTFKVGLSALLNEFSYLFGLEKGFRLTSLSIELTNNCNLNCLMCPTAAQMKRRRGFLDEGLFRKIIDTSPDLEFIFAFQWGEPFLHQRVFDLVKYASVKGIRVMVTTNGTICSDEIMRKILDSGIERLTFSADGVGPTYTEIRGFDYGQFKTNILKLKKLRDLEKKSLKIDVSMVVFDKTETDIEKFMREWKAIADGIYFIPRIIPGIRKKKCREIWRGNLTVLWDGRVVPCCVDFDGTMVVGDAVREGMSSIWNGYRMGQLRKSHRQEIFPGVCGNCGEYRNSHINSRFG